MTDYDVVVKSTDAYRVMGITEELASVGDVGAAYARLWPRLRTTLDELGLEFAAPSIAIERGTGPIEFTAAASVPSSNSPSNHALDRGVARPACPGAADSQAVTPLDS